MLRPLEFWGAFEAGVRFEHASLDLIRPQAHEPITTSTVSTYTYPKGPSTQYLGTWDLGNSNYIVINAQP